MTAYAAPAPGWDLRIGVFDGVPGDPARPRSFAIKLSGDDGALLVGQVTRRWDDRLRVELGAWHYTAAFPVIGSIDGRSTRQPRRLWSGRSRDRPRRRQGQRRR